MEEREEERTVEETSGIQNKTKSSIDLRAEAQRFYSMYFLSFIKPKQKKPTIAI